MTSATHDTLTETVPVQRTRGFVPPGFPGFTFSETVKKSISKNCT